MYVLLADLLLLVPLLYAYYLIRRGEDGYKVLSLYLLSAGFATSFKLLFRIGRNLSIDPFAFPSFHTTLASSLFFAVPNVYTFLYALLVALLRVLGGYHTWIQVLAGFITASLAWLLYIYLRERIGQEADRKSLHYGIAVASGYYMLFISPVVLGLILFLGASSIYLLKRWSLVSDIFSFYSRGGRDTGPLTLGFGLFLGSLVGVGPLTGMVLGYVDGLPSIVGRLFRTKGKSLIGMAAGYLGALISFFLLRGFYNTLFLLIILLTAPLLEYLSRIDDNLTLSVYIFLLSLVVRALGLSL